MDGVTISKNTVTSEDFMHIAHPEKWVLNTLYTGQDYDKSYPI